jgi:hypothetical protein
MTRTASLLLVPEQKDNAAAEDSAQNGSATLSLIYVDFRGSRSSTT